MQIELLTAISGNNVGRNINRIWDGVVYVAPLPFGGVALHSSSGNVAAANAVATFPAVASVTNYVTQIAITGAGATAAAIVVATLTGLLGGTASFVYGAQTGATAAQAPFTIFFGPQGVPASAVNIALVLTLPSLGLGNTNAAVEMWGYQV